MIVYLFQIIIHVFNYFIIFLHSLILHFLHYFSINSFTDPLALPCEPQEVPGAQFKKTTVLVNNVILGLMYD